MRNLLPSVNWGLNPEKEAERSTYLIEHHVREPLVATVTQRNQ
jgi:hypothetical protein